MIEKIRKSWLPDNPKRILDLGCNVGALLKNLTLWYPDAQIFGVDINAKALEKARVLVPNADIRLSGGESLPFEDDTFDLVTSFEVLEHVPESLRRVVFSEVERILRPGGTFVISVPHKGLFRWMDSNNFRFLFPNFYKRVVGRGLRDSNYMDNSKNVEFHHHFSLEEIKGLADGLFKIENYRYAGLFLYPMMDWLSWPFYRANKSGHPVRRFFEKLAGLDYQVSFGKASYGLFAQFKSQK
jgi:SAM-dependent methyltransferase